MTRSFELLQSHIASCSRIEPAKSLFIFISHNHLLKYVSHNVNRLGSVFKTVNLFLSLSLVTKQKPNMSCDLSDMDDGADSSRMCLPLLQRPPERPRTAITRSRTLDSNMQDIARAFTPMPGGKPRYIIIGSAQTGGDCIKCTLTSFVFHRLDLQKWPAIVACPLFIRVHGGIMPHLIPHCSPVERG